MRPKEGISEFALELELERDFDGGRELIGPGGGDGENAASTSAYGTA